MDAQSLALRILTHGNLPVPGEVAVELLSMVPYDEVPNSLLNFSEFSGEAVVSVAKSSPQKAKLIAGHTTDTRLQRALLEIAQSHDEVLDEMMYRNKVHDEALLLEIHELVWENQPHSTAYNRCREAVVRSAPLRYVLDFVAAGEVRGYPLTIVGVRAGSALAAGELWVLERIDAISKAHSESKDPGNFEKFIDQVGRILARESSEEHMLSVLSQAESILHPKFADRLSLSVLASAPVVDKGLLEFCLKYLPTPEEFREYQLRSAASRYVGTPPVAPSELAHMRNPYTIEALRLLASVHPGGLFNIVSELDPASEHCSEIIDLALDSNLCVLAHILLGKTTLRASKGGGLNRTPMSASQFHRALEVYESGVYIASLNRPRPEIDSAAAARSIPCDADVNDVVRLLRLVSNAAETISQFYATSMPESVSYHPTGEEMAVLLESLADGKRLEVMSKLLGMWVFSSHPNHAGPKPVNLDSALAAVVDSVPAAAIAADRSGPAYIAHVFAAEFRENVEQWRHALSLVSTALVPISKVVSASKRLY